MRASERGVFDRLACLTRGVRACVSAWAQEICKPALGGGAGSGSAEKCVLYHCLETGLRLLHPMMPFLTEVLTPSLSLSRSLARSRTRSRSLSL